MDNKFKVGDVVVYAMSTVYNDEWGGSKLIPLRYDDNGLNYGTVIDITQQGKVIVRWDSGYGIPETLESHCLMTEKEGDDLYSKLEQEFKDVEKQVSAKLKEAADAIRAANKLAETVNRPLNEMFDAVYGELYPALDDAGWNTSSFGC